MTILEISQNLTDIEETEAENWKNNQKLLMMDWWIIYMFAASLLRIKSEDYRLLKTSKINGIKNT